MTRDKMRIIITKHSRLNELICVLFGHSWTEYGNQKNSDGLILEEYNRCACCHLENRDRSGWLRPYTE